LSGSRTGAGTGTEARIGFKTRNRKRNKSLRFHSSANLHDFLALRLSGRMYQVPFQWPSKWICPHHRAAAKLMYLKVPMYLFFIGAWTECFSWGQIHYSLPFQGLNSLDFQGPPFPMALEMDFPAKTSLRPAPCKQRAH
jgi:hypothetical protein